MCSSDLKNTGQVSSYYVKDSHPAIISEGIFDKVQKEMTRRSRVVYKEDGTVEKTGKRYTSKYLFGNILECWYCGAAYRRRAERGKVVWRCGTRMESGRDTCGDSPTLNEEWIKEILARNICEDRIYDEEIVRNKVDRISVFNKHIDKIRI